MFVEELSQEWAVEVLVRRMERGGYGDTLVAPCRLVH